MYAEVVTPNRSYKSVPPSACIVNNAIEITVVDVFEPNLNEMTAISFSLISFSLFSVFRIYLYLSSSGLLLICQTRQRLSALRIYHSS